MDMTPDMREACATRNVTAIFRLLQGGGMTQRQLADLVGMSQSEVSEILKGRKVISYDVLVRVADGMCIPRGMMGLGGLVEAEPEEVDEDVERRKLLAAAGAIMFGAPVWGDPQPLTVRRVLIEPPSKVGMSDLRAYEQTVAHLKLLDRRVGGMAAREPLVVTATAGERLLKAQAAPEVHRRLRYAVSEAHRAAGWASDDVGLLDHRYYHVRQALDLAAGDPSRLAGVLGTAGSMEKNHGDANYALKYFQLAQVGAASAATDPQVGAVLAGEAVAAYCALGYLDKAREELYKSRQLFGEADASKSLPFFASYGKGFGVLASCELKLGNYDCARADGLNALQIRPEVDVRCNALDTIILATTNMQAGELREGIQQTQRALALVREVGSQRIRDRLEPLEKALASRNDSTCRDLAQAVRQCRAA